MGDVGVPVYCERCGAPQEGGTRFCTSCGEPVSAASPPQADYRGARRAPAPAPDYTDPGIPPPMAPPAVRAPGPAASLPPWLASDWPLVGLCVIILLAALFAVSAVYGGLMATMAAGPKALFSGVRVGAYFAFSAVGAKVTATTNNAPGALVHAQFLPLPWIAAAIAATCLALRFAFARLARERITLIAFAVKLAVAFGIVMAILAAVLSVGNPNEDATGFVAKVSGGEAWAFSTLIVGLAALVIVQLQGITVLRGRMNDRAREIALIALDGAQAFALLAVVLGAVTLVAALVVVDSGSARLSTLFGAVFMGVTMGVVAASYAMGAAIDLGSGHTSLFKFGFPPGADAGAAPVPFFILLAVAPAIVGWMVWRRLEKDRPTTEQDVMRVGFIIALAFAAVAFASALVSRVVLVGAAAKEDFDSGTGIGLVARPSIAGVLGLALLWGLAGGLGAAFYWATQHGVRWKAPPAPPTSTSAPPPMAPPTAPTVGSGRASVSPPRRSASPPVPQGRSATSFCSNCGAALAEGAHFCAACGARTT